MPRPGVYTWNSHVNSAERFSLRKDSEETYRMFIYSSGRAETLQYGHVVSSADLAGLHGTIRDRLLIMSSQLPLPDDISLLARFNFPQSRF